MRFTRRRAPAAAIKGGANLVIQLLRGCPIVATMNPLATTIAAASRIGRRLLKNLAVFQGIWKSCHKTYGFFWMLSDWMWSWWLDSSAFYTTPIQKTSWLYGCISFPPEISIQANPAWLMMPWKPHHPWQYVENISTYCWFLLSLVSLCIILVK